jgi:hypothetical protein
VSRRVGNGCNLGDDGQPEGRLNRSFAGLMSGSFCGFREEDVGLLEKVLANCA